MEKYKRFQKLRQLFDLGVDDVKVRLLEMDIHVSEETIRNFEQGKTISHRTYEGLLVLLEEWEEKVLEIFRPESE